MILKEKYANKI